jgi:ketosteroid isomerase-like protein
MRHAARAIGAAAAALAVVTTVHRRRRADPERIIRDYYDARAKGDDEAVRDLLADDYRGHVRTLAGTEDHDADDLAALLHSHADVFEHVEYDVQDVLRDDGRAAARVVMRADHRETGRSGEIEGLVLLHLDHGRIAEEWASWDYLGLAEQLGLADVSRRERPGTR